MDYNREIENLKRIKRFPFAEQIGIVASIAIIGVALLPVSRNIGDKVMKIYDNPETRGRDSSKSTDSAVPTTRPYSVATRPSD